MSASTKCGQGYLKNIILVICPKMVSMIQNWAQCARGIMHEKSWNALDALKSTVMVCTTRSYTPVYEKVAHPKGMCLRKASAEAESWLAIWKLALNTVYHLHNGDVNLTKTGPTTIRYQGHLQRRRSSVKLSEIFRQEVCFKKLSLSSETTYEGLNRPRILRMRNIMQNSRRPTLPSFSKN